MTRLTEGFSHFVTSMTAPVALGWSDPRLGLAPPENAALPERTPNPTRDPAIDVTDLFNPGLSHAFDKMRHRPRGIGNVFFHPCNGEVGLKPSQCRQFFIRLAGQSGLGEART